MSGRLNILAGRLIDGKSDDVTKSVCLSIEEGILTDIRPIGGIDRDEATETIDLTHCTLMPPLVDCSTKLCQSPATSGTANDDEDHGSDIHTRRIRQNVHFCHSHGVLGVADHSNTQRGMGKFHGSDSARNSITIKISQDIDPVGKRRATEYKQSDSDFVRLQVTPDLDQIAQADGITEIDHRSISDNLATAQKYSMKTVVAANGCDAVLAALEAGCDALEQGYFIEKLHLQMMKDRDVLWIPSLLRAKVSAEFSKGSLRSYYQKVLQNQVQQLRLARQLGVKIALGTGAGNRGILHGESMGEEIKLMMKAGFSFVEALQSASVIGAEFFQVSSVMPLRVGSRANFIVSRGMVQQLPRKLAYLEAIFIDGKPSAFYRKNPVKTLHKHS